MPDRLHGSANTIPRREFTLQAALTLLSGVIITVSDGCGSSNKTPTSPSQPVGDITGDISANHGHTATIRAAEITAGNEISLDIRGNATHPHTVVVSQSDMRDLQNRRTVSKTSSTDNAHSHTVTFTPA